MRSTTNEQKLFSPVQIGAVGLRHRVVMAPLTRSRSFRKEHSTSPSSTVVSHSSPIPGAISSSLRKR
jgi:2,4-dienoyl-CoA reductase-like NADH-dependent reductase (Old Yellow Enzyme family)